MTLRQVETPTLVLTRGEIAELMTLGDYRAAAAEAFKAMADGRALSPPPLHIPAAGGGFHAKGARLRTSSGEYVAIKVNGNFPGNPQRTGLPTIQGAIVLCDAANGALRAIMDSIEVTLRRTAASTALAAHLLARRQATTITICGCGEQGRAQLAALADELYVMHAFVWDIDAAAAGAFVDQMKPKFDFTLERAENLADATRRSDVIVACTTAREPYLDVEHVPPGAFVAAVGADSHDKSELTPRLMARSKVVVDALEQCRSIGDLHHAVAAGVMTPEGVYATLAELVAGRKPGRTSADEVTIFDSTGVAVQDAAAAILIYERAQAQRAGVVRCFGD
jgi:ornithine cyclodeaminase/alanine dehydrogenase-like protein (mu-crystallin family)